jgi:hypothetical protein
MNLETVNHALGIAAKTTALIVAAAFAPAMYNELQWLYANKARECALIKSEYSELVASSTGLNTRAFEPGEGSAINQAFLGTVLASSTQAPNAKLVQAAVKGCPTSSYSLQKTSW